ncbi:MAG: diguanylate cyclase domain-containing protein [Acidimicrobiales bacterium]
MADSAVEPTDIRRSIAAATAALAAAIALHDPAQSRRDALRAVRADELARQAHLAPDDHIVAVAAALVCDASVLLHNLPAAGKAASTALSAALIERIPHMSGVARTVRHRHEAPDGGGQPHGLAGYAVPPAALILMEADQLPAADPDTGPTLDEALACLDVDSERPIDLRTTGRDRAALMETIGEILRAVERVEQILALIGEQALAAIGATTVSIAKIDLREGVLQVLVNVGGLDGHEERFPLDELYLLDAIPDLELYQSGGNRLRTIAGDDSQVRYLEARQITSEAVTPLLVDGQLWGIVWATTANRDDPIDYDGLSMLQLVAEQMAAGISQATRYAEFERLAFRDPLTGLGNRRVLESTLRAVFDRADDGSVSVIMADVDSLKVVNDTLGHEAGDDLLIDASRALSTAAASVTGATVCRVGGDEFCVVIVGDEAGRAAEVAEQALELFRAADPERSISCGVAIARPGMQTASDLLRAADEAQYARKRAHKLAAGLPVPPPPGTGGRRQRRAN